MSVGPMKIYGPIGYIYHSSSGKLVHPYGGSANPIDNTELVLHSDKDNPSRLQMRFVAEQREGHFGYIEHVSSGKIVHPSGGSLNPGENTKLVLHSDRHHAALFRFNEADNTLKHKGGKTWHPSGGSPNPSNDTSCVLHSTSHDAAMFYFGGIDGVPMSPYTSPNVTGNWKVIEAFVTPKATRNYGMTYKVGRSQITTFTPLHAQLKISAEAAYKLCNASAECSAYVEKSDKNTWSEEMEVRRDIHVEKGETVVIWQYVFTVERLGEKFSFNSSIIGDTNSLDSPPKADFFDRY